MNIPAQRSAPPNGARWLTQALEAEGVRTLFGYPGGTIMPFYDALVDSSLKHILVRHEQGAALAANGYARASGKVGVCVATSGPGASNLVTGIADAMLDSVPMVCLTGQVATTLMGTVPRPGHDRSPRMISAAPPRGDIADRNGVAPMHAARLNGWQACAANEGKLTFLQDNPA